MTWNNFQGAAKRIDDIDLPRIGAKIGVGEDEIHAVIDVEARGSGFDSIGRPAMLFESHWFYRHLKGSERTEAVRQGLAHKNWKTAKAANRAKYGSNYPKESYTRLKQAMKINETAALMSASWGMGQIMGFNHKAAGYTSAQEMVLDFLDDEENHLEAMINFIISKGLDDELRRHDWRGFAKGYNGAGYASNNYHTKLAKSYAKWSRIKDTPWREGMDSKPVSSSDPVASQQADRLSQLPAPRSRIYLFIGLIGAYYSAGLDALAEKLQTAGFAVSVHPFGAGVSVRKQIEREYTDGLFNNFAVIGHSLGANAALRVSKKLSSDGVPVKYVASIDPTLRFTVSGFSADNFRSNDIRDRRVEGATEIPRNDLSHIEIDDDIDVHNHIINQCKLHLTASALETKDHTMPIDQTKTASSSINRDDIIAVLISALLKDKTGVISNDSEVTDAIKLILGSAGSQLSESEQSLLAKLGIENAADDGAKVDIQDSGTTQKPPLTIVNGALGNTIGHFLDGRKSAIGIVGLLATYLVPAIAPQATIFVDLLRAFGLEGAAGVGADTATTAANAAASAAAEAVKTGIEDTAAIVAKAKEAADVATNAAASAASPAKNIFGPIFSAMLAWGGLGKIDKWVRLLRMK